LNHIQVGWNIDLLPEIKKRDTDKVVMKLAAVQTIHTLYLEQDWLHICMDGSLTDRSRNAGARIQCKLFSFYLSLGQHGTHFDGGIEAMNTAVKQLFE
jgi:hypothetical protein